jgi:hypothetical protein
VLVLLDRIDATTAALSTNLQNLAARGASGLMTTTTADVAGGSAPLAPAATLSAGAKAVGLTSAEEPHPVQPGEPGEGTPFGKIAELYQQRAGQPATAAIVYPDIKTLQRANAAPNVAAEPGLLGQLLAQHHIVTAVVGSSDLPGNRFRPAAVVAMDANGAVPVGSFRTDRSVPSQVLPLRVDPNVLQKKVDAVLTKARFIVVDWGDTSRIARLRLAERDRLGRRNSSGVTLTDRLTQARQDSLSSLDTFLSALLQKINLQRDVLIVLSPSPGPSDQRAGREYAPIFIGGGLVSHGMLTSPTTHRRGLVSNTDIAPTVLSLFRIPVPAAMDGSVMAVESTAFPVTDTEALARKLSTIHREHRVVEVVALLLWILAIGIALYAIDRRLRRLVAVASAPRRGRRAQVAAQRSNAEPGRRWVALTRILLASAASIPLVLIALALFPVAPLPITLVLEILLSLALGVAWASMVRTTTFQAAALPLGLAAFALLVDLASGSHLASTSMLGPNAAGGRSVFGLGSVQAGVALAAVGVASGALARVLRRRRRPRLAVYVAAAVLAIALSLTFAGGTPIVALAAIPAVFVLADLIERAASVPDPKRAKSTATRAGTVRATADNIAIPRRRWTIAAVAWGVLLLVAGVVLLVVRASAVSDVPDAGAPGHSGLGAMTAIAAHQGARAAHLLVASPWTIAILLAVAAFALIRLRMQRAERELAATERPPPRIDRFGWSVTAGLLAAGVVAALSSPTGAPAAAVTLMALALMAAATTLDRAGPGR